MSNPYPPGPGDQPQQPGGWPQQQQPQQPGGWPQQQPGPGGYPGQPGPAPYPGQPGAMPPGFGAPPPPPPRGGKLKKILLPIVGVLVLGGIGLVVTKVLNKDDATNAKAGDCLTSVEGGIGKKEMPKIVECTEAGARWKVIDKFEDTADTGKCDALEDKGALASFYWTGDGKGVLCLGLTSKTTVEDVKKFDPISSMGFTDEDLEAMKEDVKSKGVVIE